MELLLACGKNATFVYVLLVLGNLYLLHQVHFYGTVTRRQRILSVMIVAQLDKSVSLFRNSMTSFFS